MTDAHHTRSHSAWAASATARNTTCAGAMAMATLAGEEKESEAAAWGTAVHQLSERCLASSSSVDAVYYLGGIEKTESFSFTIDEEMTNCAQEFIDYCRGRTAEYQKIDSAGIYTWWLERNFSLDAIRPPFEAGGTGDCIIYFPKWKMLEIVDLKGGRGVVVEVKGNAQARTYALGALLEFPELDVEIVRSTIVQPRAPHKDGRIRSEEIHVADLVDWTAWLIGKMNRAKTALGRFNGINEVIGAARNRILFDEWSDTWLTTGACTFCPAEGFCPKRRKEALAVAGQKAVDWFEDPSIRAPVPTNAPAISSAEELGHTLDGLEALESWIKAMRSHAHTRAERGEKIPGWILAEKIGNRAWIAEDDGITLGKLVLEFEMKPETFLDQPALKSVAQIEKALGPRKSELAKYEGKLWHKPVKGSNLVSETKTTRTPAKSKPEQHFEALG
jgi:Protein of unknown function (DUF2800)